MEFEMWIDGVNVKGVFQLSLSKVQCLLCVDIKIVMRLGRIRDSGPSR